MPKKLYNYIEVDETGKITGACQLAGPVTKDEYIETETYNPGVVGKIYDLDKKTISDPEPEEPAQEQEIDPATTTDTEFRSLVLEKLGYKITK